MRSKVAIFVAVPVILLICAYVFFRVPFVSKTPYQRVLRYYGTVLISQWKESKNYKFAFDPKGQHVKTAKERLKVPVDELELPVFFLWIEPIEKKAIDIAYRDKRKYSLYHEDRMLLQTEEYSMPYVDAVIEFEGKQYDAGVKLRGEGIWHWIGNPSYRVKLDDKDRILDMGPRINMRRNEYMNIVSFLLHFMLGEDAGLITPKTMIGHLFINGEYQGLRTVFEHYDEGFVDRHLPGAELFRETYQQPQEVLYSYFGEDPNDYPHWNSLTADRRTNSWQDFISLLRTVSLDDDETFQKEIGEHLDIQSFIKFTNLAVIAGAPYLISLDNTWLTNPDDGRLIPVVSDTPGYTDREGVLTRDIHEFYNPIGFRLFTLMPDIMAEKDDVLREMLTNEASVEKMNQRIDEVVANIDHDVEFSSSDFHNAVSELKSWIERRYVFITSELDEQTPHVVSQDGEFILKARPVEKWRIEGALDTLIEPKISYYRPDVFENIDMGSKFDLAKIELHRNQVRFDEVSIPFPAGEVWITNVRTGEKKHLNAEL